MWNTTAERLAVPEDALCTAALLAAPFGRRPKKMLTDASAYGLGFVLLLLKNLKNWPSFFFTSRILK